MSVTESASEMNGLFFSPYCLRHCGFLRQFEHGLACYANAGRRRKEVCMRAGFGFETYLPPLSRFLVNVVG